MTKHKVYLEPVGIEIEADEDEHVLEKSFRQGVMLMHGCKEGQCSACKSFVLDGDVESIDRKVTYYYEARTQRDLFYLDKLQEMSERLPKFRFVPALSEAGPEDEWDGETGLITDVVDRLEGDLTSTEAYLAGPPPMVDTAIELLGRKGVGEDNIFYDKFTVSVPPEEEVTEGPTKGPLDQILAKLRTRVGTARGELEAATDEVAEVVEAVESAPDAALPFDKETVQKHFQDAQAALESAEEELAGGDGEPSTQEEEHSTRQP